MLGVKRKKMENEWEILRIFGKEEGNPYWPFHNCNLEYRNHIKNNSIINWTSSKDISFGIFYKKIKTTLRGCKLCRAPIPKYILFQLALLNKGVL